MFGYNSFRGCMVAILYMLLSVVVTVAFSAIFAVVSMWLWNYALVSTFSFPEITFWKMFAIIVLVRIAFSPITINNNKN